MHCRTAAGLVLVIWLVTSQRVAGQGIRCDAGHKRNSHVVPGIDVPGAVTTTTFVERKNIMSTARDPAANATRQRQSVKNDVSASDAP